RLPAAQDRRLSLLIRSRAGFCRVIHRWLASNIVRDAPGGKAISMQISAVHIEPYFRALDIRVKSLDQPPESHRAVELDEMADLVRGKIIEHEGRREHETPGKRQGARVRA